MGSKVIVFLGLLLAVVLLMSSEVAARDLTETSSTTVDAFAETNGAVNDAEFFKKGYARGPVCKYGRCCGKYKYKYKCRCCSFAGEKVDDAQTTQAQPQN